MLIIEIDSIHSVSGDNTMFYLSTVGYVLSNKQSVDSQSAVSLQYDNQSNVTNLQGPYVILLPVVDLPISVARFRWQRAAIHLNVNLWYTSDHC